MKVLRLLLFFAALSASLPAVAQDTSRAFDPAAPLPALLDVSRFDFAYDAWEGAIVTDEGRHRIKSNTGRGGFGRNVKLDLSDKADHTPAVVLTIHPDNQMRNVRLFLSDADGTRGQFTFDLRRVPVGERRVVPTHGAAALSQPNQLSRPGEVEGLDLANITQWQIQGDWRGAAADITIEAVVWIATDAAIIEQRERFARRQAAEAQQRAEETAAVAERRERLLREPQRTADSPTVRRIATVAPHIMGLEIEAGSVPPVRQVAYEPGPEDQVRLEGPEVLLRDGDGFAVGPRDRILLRPDERGRAQRVGELVPEHAVYLPDQELIGQPLEMLTVDEPRAYRITSTDDNRFASGVRPVSVHRKSKPIDHAMPTRGPAMRHRIYLVLPDPLREGATYTVHFDGLNTREPSVTLAHDPRVNRSEAIHVSHIGFRPGDPFKRAYLSLWMGTGGGLRYEGIEAFELLDERGQAVFSGEVRHAHVKGEPEALREARDYVQTDVYHLDFHAFDTPGVYRVHVAGVGVSEAFEIRDDVWARAFAVSMQGFLHHRSGIALGPPVTDYQRPLSFHPDMGLMPVQTDVTTIDGESKAIDESLRRLTEAGASLTPVPEAWGGYMDAGDWDRRTPHLHATYLLLELLDLFPEAFASIELKLPEAEAGNGLPGLLNEALWNLAFFHRLQHADGGVRGGVESTSHPRAGETSWQESLPVGVFAADPITSYLFAACAAKASRVLEPLDAQKSVVYADAAKRAWAWAEQHREAFMQRHEPRRVRTMAEDRALAAIELYRVTGQAAYHDAAVAWIDEFIGKANALETPMFAYAILPEPLGDAARKAAARDTLIAHAERAIAFGHGNSYNLTTHVTTLPMMGYVGYFSVPGMVSRVLPRAHYLTGEERYLAGTVMACQFSAGANPDNMAYTTGVGHNPPRNPLHIDSRRTGQPAPAGITVYGPSDPAEPYAFNNWMHTWFLGQQKTPESRTWPPHEAYTDIYLWPAMCEYTITQTIAPTAYYWGYLAASSRATPGER